MTLIKAPAKVHPAFNQIPNYYTEQEITISCSSEPTEVNGKSFVQSSVPFYGQSNVYFNLQDVVSSWLVNESTELFGNWAFHDWNLKVLYGVTGSDNTTQNYMALNAVRQTAQSTDLVADSKSPFLTIREEQSGILQVPKYKGFPVGVDVMDSNNYPVKKELNRYGSISGVQFRYLTGGVEYKGKMYVTCNAVGVYSSEDGVNFTLVLPYDNNNNLGGIKVVNGFLVVLCNYSSDQYTRSFYTSLDGVNFTLRTITVDNTTVASRSVNDLTFDGTNYYAAITRTPTDTTTTEVNIAVLDSAFSQVGYVSVASGTTFNGSEVWAIQYVSQVNKFFIQFANNNNPRACLFTAINASYVIQDVTSYHGGGQTISQAVKGNNPIVNNNAIYFQHSQTGFRIAGLADFSRFYSGASVCTTPGFKGACLLGSSIWGVTSTAGSTTLCTVREYSVPSAAPTAGDNLQTVSAYDTDLLLSAGSVVAITFNGDVYVYGSTGANQTSATLWTTSEIAAGEGSDLTIKIETESGETGEFEPEAPIHVDIYSMPGSAVAPYEEPFIRAWFEDMSEVKHSGGFRTLHIETNIPEAAIAWGRTYLPEGQ